MTKAEGIFVMGDSLFAKRLTLKGREAQTLHALALAGPRGVTALELSNTWALRLGAYVHTLRHRRGLNIETLREPHQGGSHGRYVLHTPVTVLSWQGQALNGAGGRRDAA